MVMVMRQRKLLIQLFMANLSHTIAILAYNNHELTLKNIQHLINNGYKENILLFDNGSNPSLKKNDRSGLIRSSKTGRYRDAPQSAQALNQKKFFHLMYDNCSKDLFLERKYLKLKYTIS